MCYHGLLGGAVKSAEKEFVLRDGSCYQNGWNFKRGGGRRGGSFSIQKFMLLILALCLGFFLRFPKKICNIVIRRSEGGGGGSKAFWNFFENSSVLVPRPVPNQGFFLTFAKHLPCKRRVPLPNRMNSRKNSKRPLTPPPPSFSENHVAIFLW